MESGSFVGSSDLMVERVLPKQNQESGGFYQLLEFVVASCDLIAN